MDRVIVASKLESLRRCVERVEARRAESAEALRADVDRQDIVSLNLTRAVQLCVDIASHVLSERDRRAPDSMGEAFDLLADEGIIDADLARRMRAAVGFRNVAVHAYQAIDWDIVQRITQHGLDDFRAYAVALGRLLDQLDA